MIVFTPNDVVHVYRPVDQLRLPSLPFRADLGRRYAHELRQVTDLPPKFVPSMDFDLLQKALSVKCGYYWTVRYSVLEI